MRITRKLWLWILVLALLSPLGLISSEEQTYTFGLGRLGYVVSAFVGISLIALITLFIGKKIGKKE